MIYLFDVGNTHTVVGVAEDKKILFELRIKTDTGRTTDEYRAIILPLLRERLPRLPQNAQSIICSVVPAVTAELSAFCVSALMTPPLVIGPGTKTCVPIRLSDPSSVGADRIANAVGVKNRYGVSALVVDFGTATSFDYVNQQGDFEGGVIIPGMATALESLVRNTAKLPRVDITWPTSHLGKSTTSAMQVGSVLGYHYLIEGLIAGLEKEVGKISHVIATGGLGQLFAQHSLRIDRYDSDLTLWGMKCIAELNANVSA